MDQLIQWNCNGCVHHYCELKTILSELSPFCVCLQETHFLPNQPYSLRGYRVSRKDDEPNIRARGGVAVLVRQDVHYTNIDLNTNLQAVAVRVSSPLTVTVCSLYLPRFDWQINDLLQLVNQLPPPFLLLGDFNAHNPIWGSTQRDARGRLIEQLLEDEDLTLLNSGASTYLNARSSDFSAIDLSICSPQLAARLTWQPLDHLYGSDHFPISISTGTARVNYCPPRRWQLEHANWDIFERDLNRVVLSNSIETDVGNLSISILEAAERAIPCNSGRPLKKSVPWWNDQVRDAIARKKRAFNRFRRYPTQENLIAFKRCRAQARRLTLESKRLSWNNYVSSLASNTTTSEIWHKIRSIAGLRPSSSLSSLLVNGIAFTTPSDIAEVLASHFESTSSSENYDPDFLASKADRERPLDFSTFEDLNYNVPFSMTELEEALSQVKESAPGPDRIPYSFIQHLPHDFRQVLLDLYNQIWSTGHYPDQWRKAIIVPILKEGKDPRSPSSYRPISLTCCLSTYWKGW